jgi:hypothetical protein
MEKLSIAINNDKKVPIKDNEISNMAFKLKSYTTSISTLILNKFDEVSKKYEDHDLKSAMILANDCIISTQKLINVIDEIIKHEYTKIDIKNAQQSGEHFVDSWKKLNQYTNMYFDEYHNMFERNMVVDGYEKFYNKIFILYNKIIEEVKFKIQTSVNLKFIRHYTTDTSVRDYLIFMFESELSYISSIIRILTDKYSEIINKNIMDNFSTINKNVVYLEEMKKEYGSLISPITDEKQKQKTINMIKSFYNLCISTEQVMINFINKKPSVKITETVENKTLLDMIENKYNIAKLVIKDLQEN